ncbi:hypothetical protein FDECE_2712 [Fusarium decemcellulare]|nr:hypothetical protein FDECE_2712 [Fusarium decemcellulare]
MKTSALLLALTGSALGAPQVGVGSPKLDSRQVDIGDIGWNIYMGSWHGQGVNTWVLGNNVDDICNRAGTGSPFPYPADDVVYCDIEFGAPGFCDDHIFKIVKGKDGDCSPNGSNPDKRYGVLVDVTNNNEEVGLCNKDIEPVRGTSCPDPSGSRAYYSLMTCTVDYKKGRCGA